MDTNETPHTAPVRNLNAGRRLAAVGAAAILGFGALAACSDDTDDTDDDVTPSVEVEDNGDEMEDDMDDLGDDIEDGVEDGADEVEDGADELEDEADEMDDDS